jgi:hypothetical protein
MKKAISILMIIVFSIVCVSPAMAGRVVDRQVNQQKRIHKGVHSGELTGREVWGLEKEQRHVQRLQKKAWSDGVLTPKERVRLEHQQNKANGHIYRLKHNDIDR